MCFSSGKNTILKFITQFFAAFKCGIIQLFLGEGLVKAGKGEKKWN
jgi:hypothetical protein